MNIEKNIIELIKQDNRITQEKIAKELNISMDVIKRKIKKLKDNGQITREGNKNNGFWKINIY